MLFLIGLGLKPKHITMEAVEAIKKADQVFLENYTSKYSEGTTKELEEITQKKIRVFSRKEVEEGIQNILLTAKKNNVAMLVFGNPLTATTHIQALLDAKKLGVKIQVIAGISVTNFLAKTGLDEYKFGRITTIVEPTAKYAPESFFEFIKKNQAAELHTMCLLDTGDGKKFLDAKTALETLKKIDQKKKTHIMKKQVVLVLEALGSENERITAGRFSELEKKDFTGFPQSIIICGKLNEKEKEALSELHGCNF